MDELVPNRDRKCLICAVDITATHFGMDCCRACAAFFKRTRLSGKMYSCRAGHQKCPIIKGDSFMCRRCRFNRCVAVGMVYDGPLRVNKKPSDDVDNSYGCNTDSMKPSTSRAPECILDRIGREFNASVERRRAQEERILAVCDDATLVPHPTHKVYLSNYKTSVQMYNICVMETLTFFREAFPSLAVLSEQERDALFKGYIAKFSMIESHYRTRKIWGEMRRYAMNSVLICADLERTDLWLGEDEGGDNRKTLLETMRSYATNQFALILPMANKAHITDKEFYAILALVLCEIDVTSEVSDRVLSTLDEIRSEVFENLQRYYKEEMGLSDFSTRLGNLMTLNHSIRECNSLFQEYFRMFITVFDLYRSEELIKDLFM